MVGISVLWQGLGQARQSPLNDGYRVRVRVRVRARARVNNNVILGIIIWLGIIMWLYSAQAQLERRIHSSRSDVFMN
jgi:hypothetical protein